MDFISKKNINLFLRFSIAVIILGILFKIFHLQFAFILFIVGALGIIVFYSLRFLQKQPKKLLDYSKLFLVVTFLIHYVLRVFHYSFNTIFSLLFQIALVVFIILSIRDVFFVKHENVIENDREHRSNTTHKNINYLLYALAAIGIVLGSQFKILHWQFGFITGDILLTIGLLSATAAVIRGLGDS